MGTFCRVHNLGVPVTNNLGTAYRGADLEAQLAVMLRQAVGGLTSGGLRQAKDGIEKAAVNVLHAYRRHCASASNPGQLILPEALKLMPLYTLAMQKMACFRCNTRPHHLNSQSCMMPGVWKPSAQAPRLSLSAL